MQHFLEINQLRFWYQTPSLESSPLLSLEKLSLDANQSLFLFGPSGYGKSTLLNLLAGVLKPNEGELIINGAHLHKMSAAKRDTWRGDHLGYVFQNFNLIPYLSLRENIELPLKFSALRKSKAQKNDSLRLLERMGLSALAHKKANELSLGQQQRVAVCRALIGSPSLILADEPTSALDENNTEELMRLIADERKNNPIAMIFVSHDMRLKKHFDLTWSLPDINKNFNNKIF